MPFWTYMLQCRDRTLYVGHTDDLDVRMAQHQEGGSASYTARKRPVTLVWCEEFPSRYEALAAERRIKGWRKEKKLALIRGDWDEISRLARAKKERPSTSSGRTAVGRNIEQKIVRPEPVEGRHFLLPNASLESDSIKSVRVSVLLNATTLRLRYILVGAISRLWIPAMKATARRDELWRSTCFEAFVGHSDGSYWEFNFSPSTEWAAYEFTAYRAGMAPLSLADPAIRTRFGPTELLVEVHVELPNALDQARLGLSAVIEEASSAKSYWALAHPPGPPDFHHPDCFALELAAPRRP